MKASKIARRTLAALLAGLALAAGCASLRGDWRTASHEPVGSAPDPKTTREAVVQVYAARTFGWRGVFGVHTWVAVKPVNAEAYTVYEVIGWRLRYGDSVVAIHERPADARARQRGLGRGLCGAGGERPKRHWQRRAQEEPSHVHGAGRLGRL